MKKKTKKVIAIITGAVIALSVTAVVGFSAFVGKQVAEGMLYMNVGNDTKTNSIRHLEQMGFDLESFQKTYGNNVSHPSIIAEDGNVVPADVYGQPESRQTVILAHGLGGERMTNLPIAQMYLENGWNVITYDQRGAGENPDTKITFGYYEKLDITALVDYAKTELRSERIVVHGQSMGAASTALYAVTDHAKENVEAVVLDSCFGSMEEMFLGVWREMEGTEGIPEDYVVACGDLYLQVFYGFGFEDADICEQMKKNNVNTLMLQMERDEMVPNETADEMYTNILAQNKKICYFDSEHIEGLKDAPEEYENAVFSFLGE